ncbi:UNVERIFIED_CONTAM: putative plastidic glucose transporter 2 [Sesamum radiatum]|uniref:Plastidic glucose transporter 2 n=1 Tax=Sesamum radiatum TaxID=300843 RepID=A0AAW2WIS8_SESRA
MYKRVPSRDLVDGFDREEILGQSQNGVWNDIGNPSWKRPLPHVLVATLTSFLFGYHLGVVNDTLESISLDLGFSGSTMAEGLVVSTCLGGAFLGSIFSGWIADGLGRRRAFQLSALPMILGASMSATTSGLEGMLLGRFFVGTGMGVGPPVAALYVSEVSPAFVRGTYGSFTQIATCFGLLAALFIGIPAKKVLGWFVLTFSLGAGPVPSLLLSEIFPNRIRAKAMAVCMAVHWVINFFVGLLFLHLLELLGPQILYTIFATFCLIAVAFVKKNVVETKGKSLQEIEMALLPAV